MGVLHIPYRPPKPRKYGWTAVNDRGIGLNAWMDIAKMAGSYVDFAKLGIGTAYLIENLDEKISWLKTHDIEVILGGTLFETYWAQGQLDEYRALLEHSALNWVEISSGSYPIPLDEKVALVKDFTRRHFHVMAEVGQKSDVSLMRAQDYADEALKLRDAGADKVILEGRGTGRGGIYGQDGALDVHITNAVLEVLSTEELIFEAPLESQQILFIREFGSNVNLGNIDHQDILSLEALRVGLRYDTMDALGLSAYHEHVGCGRNNK